MDLELKSRVAIVLGAGGGLGRAIAVAMAKEGADIAIADINAEALKATKEAAAAVGGRAIELVWDLADLGQIERHVGRVETELGGIDILVNNTGGPPPTPAGGQSPDKWTEYFNAMVLPVIALTDRVLPGMKERKWGRIITSTSSGVVAPIPNLGISNSLRSALVGWSKTLAREIAPFGITSNIVLPGRIATDRIHFLDQAKAKRENIPVEAVIAASTSSIPAARYGKPEEYGDVVTFLASARASYVTGSVIRVDGGLIASI